MKKINSILIANRGEIASRIIRTCRKLGIRSIAVFSDADQFAPFVAEADIAVRLCGNTPTETYLAVDKLLDAARRTGADAIHPGYGFLAENADFAQRCAEAGLVFIGPKPSAIAAMGSKAEAKALMRAAGVPVVPGYDGENQNLAQLLVEGRKIGFPLLFKAVAGGGGKGMRIVNSEEEFGNAFISAKSEAQNAFGDDRLILEKYFTQVRHIEFQIFGDQHGNAIHLLERECTIQRRYQKIIEESPSPALSPELRAEMGKAAVAAAQALSYDNAGTVEFILTDTDQFYFLEVNTRLQVEHPVTEMITGLDLVEMQIRMAEGEPLALTQDEVMGNGYAIECRLYAEDARRNFMPDTGKILHWSLPSVNGLRVDSGVQQGSKVSVYYDPMLAKIIVWGHDRAEAHRKMNYTLQEMVCLGLTTNRAFLLALLNDSNFQAGNYDTHFLQHWKDTSSVTDLQKQKACIAATLFEWKSRENQRTVLSALPSGWRNSFSLMQFSEYLIGDELIRMGYRFRNGQFEMKSQNLECQVRLQELKCSTLRLEIDGLQTKAEVVRDGQGNIWVQLEGADVKLQVKDRFPVAGAAKENGGYRSPMPSQVLRILVQTGQKVEAGAGLITLSSMKMENTIVAEKPGTIAEIFVREGQNIEAQVELLVMRNEELEIGNGQ